VDAGIEVGIVTGGGNFWRGRTSEAIDRTKADQIGMLATVMNCIYVSEIFRFVGMGTEIFTPFQCAAFTELFSNDKAVAALAAGKVAFFAGGIGHPYFSTDMGTVLRAIEIEADMILSARAVDGVYDADPKTHPDAHRFDRISYMDVLSRGLNVMDATATSLCMDNDVPMIVFDLTKPGNIKAALQGEPVGTVVE